MRRPPGWTERRICPWCGTGFIASHTHKPRNRYCSHLCANKAKAIVCTHYADMGRKGRAAFTAKQDARWAEKVTGMTALEAYKAGRRDGYDTRFNFERGRKKRAEAA